MDRDKLDPKGLKAATAAVDHFFRNTSNGTFADMAEAAITAYLSVLQERAAKQYAEIMAILDNPQPPTDALRKLYRDYAPLLSHTRAAAPSGWKMVPVEPTREMRESGYHANAIKDAYGFPHHHDAEPAYRAMLRAAPSPSSARPEIGDTDV
ncbi:MAG TPA: hypothetical protein VEA41_21505 [Salinarimonas sp.]|nr:hypothetical protein [Salinarimonas sp.]